MKRRSGRTSCPWQHSSPALTAVPSGQRSSVLRPGAAGCASSSTTSAPRSHARAHRRARTTPTPPRASSPTSNTCSTSGRQPPQPVPAAVQALSSPIVEHPPATASSKAPAATFSHEHTDIDGLMPESDPGAAVGRSNSAASLTTTRRGAARPRRCGVGRSNGFARVEWQRVPMLLPWTTVDFLPTLTIRTAAPDGSQRRIPLGLHIERDASRSPPFGRGQSPLPRRSFASRVDRGDDPRRPRRRHLGPTSSAAAPAL